MPKSFAEKRKLLKGVRGFLHRHPRTTHAVGGAALGAGLGSLQTHDKEGKKLSKSDRRKMIGVSAGVYGALGGTLGHFKTTGRANARGYRREHAKLRASAAKGNREFTTRALKADKGRDSVREVLDVVNKDRKKNKFFPQSVPNKDMEKKNAAHDQYLETAIAAMFQELEDPTFEPVEVPELLAKQASVALSAFFEELGAIR